MKLLKGIRVIGLITVICSILSALQGVSPAQGQAQTIFLFLIAGSVFAMESIAKKGELRLFGKRYVMKGKH